MKSNLLYILLKSPMLFVAIISVSLSLTATAVDGSPQYLQAYIGAYPSSNSSAGGSVILQFAPPSTTEKEGMITIVMDVHNIAPNCIKTNDAENGCGIHIHNGTTNCDNEATVGPHYWNKEIFPSEDPWLPVKYESDAYGNSKSVIQMNGGNGFSATVNDNHNIVIHNANGGRIACGVLRFRRSKDIKKSLYKNSRRRPKKAKASPKAADKSTPKSTKGSDKVPVNHQAASGKGRDSNSVNHQAAPGTSNLMKEVSNKERTKKKEVGSNKKSAKKRS